MSNKAGCSTFTWVIDNFSLLPTIWNRLSLVLNSGKGTLKSPLWKTESNKETQTWELRACQSSTDVQFALCSLCLNNSINKLEMSLISSCYEVQLKQVRGGRSFIIERSELFGANRQSNLPNDTLTVCMRMWKKDMKSSEFRIRSVLQIVNVTWNIVKVDSSDFHSNKLMDKDNESEFYMTLCRNKKELTHMITFRVIKNERYIDSQILECKLSTKDDRGRVILRELSPGLFATWNCEISISEQNKTIRNLLLQFESIVANYESPVPLLSSSQSVKKDTVETESVLDSPGTLNKDLLLLLRETILSDATLNTDGKSFSAHKLILSARSSVFRAMFEDEKMSEGRSGVVDIEDVDSETVQRMLVFLYGDSLDDVQWEEASKLYYAADKYAVHLLKKKCVEILQAGLAVNNACEAIVLADRHSDDELMRCAVDFIRDHEEVVSSAEWERLEEGNSRLTSKILRELYVKKGKKYQQINSRVLFLCT